MKNHMSDWYGLDARHRVIGPRKECVMAGLGKKAPAMASAAFVRLFEQASKAALIDALWCACQLGTDESEPQIATQAARNTTIALIHRRDRVPVELISQSENRIDSDPECTS